MKIFYSPSSGSVGGFFNSEMHAGNIPADAIEITSDQRSDLIEKLGLGYTISVHKDGSISTVASAARTLSDVQSDLCSQIDAEANTAYESLSTKYANLIFEYQKSRADAQAYKDAGYSGTVPSTVQSYATEQDWTARQAADSILSIAGNWDSAIDAIRSARLLGKKSVNAATTESDANTAADAAQANIAAAVGA